jgi:ketosteroid isomerase-like protein
MTDTAHVQEWLAGYRRAWESNDEPDIRALFTDDAQYADTPWEEPRRGADAIVANWLEHRDEPGDTTFQVRSIHLDGDTAFVQAVSDYVKAGKVYDNLWVIGFAPDGRARSFTEWYMARPQA